MAKTQLNVRVDEDTARAARERALARGMSVNRYIEELVRQDAGEVGHTFVEAAADFMKQYESVFAEEFGTDREGSRPVREAPRLVHTVQDAARPLGEGRR
ncbi:antitoxin [Streptomyces sp. BG9H]|uniref:Antitoxin n=1 Tax=Streptomyces anatolicus TaxID=2675858 RepID=A0ABS6YGD6_9ACTN|nr:antitoxin [Streptomyces anatolicus]MBW5420484.1 antitoxin [Streptomyces anatolicus]